MRDGQANTLKTNQAVELLNKEFKKWFEKTAKSHKNLGKEYGQNWLDQSFFNKKPKDIEILQALNDNNPLTYLQSEKIKTVANLSISTHKEVDGLEYHFFLIPVKTKDIREDRILDVNTAQLEQQLIKKGMTDEVRVMPYALSLPFYPEDNINYMYYLTRRMLLNDRLKKPDYRFLESVNKGFKSNNYYLLGYDIKQIDETPVHLDEQEIEPHTKALPLAVGITKIRSQRRKNAFKDNFESIYNKSEDKKSYLVIRTSSVASKIENDPSKDIDIQFYFADIKTKPKSIIVKCKDYIGALHTIQDLKLLMIEYGVDDLNTFGTLEYKDGKEVFSKFNKQLDAIDDLLVSERTNFYSKVANKPERDNIIQFRN